MISINDTGRNDSRIVHWGAQKIYPTDGEPTGAHITIAPSNAGAFDIKEAS